MSRARRRSVTSSQNPSPTICGSSSSRQQSTAQHRTQIIKLLHSPDEEGGFYLCRLTSMAPAQHGTARHSTLAACEGRGRTRSVSAK
jgi:hypothetical protein